MRNYIGSENYDILTRKAYFGGFTAVLLSTPVFWDVMLRSWESGYRHFEGTLRLHSERSDGPLDTSSSKRPDRFWSAGAISAGVKRPKHDADHSSYPMPQLRVTGAPLTHTPAWRAQGQLYLYLWSSREPYRVKIRANGPNPEQLHYSQLLRSPPLDFTVQYNLISHFHDFFQSGLFRGILRQQYVTPFPSHAFFVPSFSPPPPPRLMTVITSVCWRT
jgi:hypothetical protein